MPPMKAKNFKSQFDERERLPQNPGSGERILYTSQLREDGQIELTPSGKEDLYASIQSHRDSVDIHILLARYRNGDADALSRVQGAYGDFTEMPGSYAELLNALIKGESYFNSLPVEVKEKFGHSFENFMVSMDDMSGFLEKLGLTTGSNEPETVVNPDPSGGDSE